jgi:hypothetical protein
MNKYYLLRSINKLSVGVVFFEGLHLVTSFSEEKNIHKFFLDIKTILLKFLDIAKQVFVYIVKQFCNAKVQMPLKFAFGYHSQAQKNSML